jgi:hypothetical protein
MDAYTFALALGTAGPAAMTVLGFHHGHAPGRSGHGHHSSHVRGGGHSGDQTGSHAGHHHHAAGHQHPTIAPALADALARARLITVSGGSGTGAAEAATQSMMNVIPTVLAAQLVAKGDLAGLGEIVGPARRDGAEAPAPPTKLAARPGRAAGD